MRAIKFRGANREDGWVYGSLILGRKEYRGENLDKPVYAYIARFKDNGEVFPIEPVRVAPSTVCQFTGLYDMYGKEIYEGDIICRDGSNRHYVVQMDEEFYSIYALFYRVKGNTELQFADFLKRYYTDAYEVIGNIFDNPELL
jgi:uncharacterized phage protein (TIGR01671 family)